ncbi:hypothetical protein F5X99DRAFT_411441 [Biscogniauxia marginata]|nr:hypothetical protein F5X99DRAFT_411441 [Biscogniauxia marginata]
MPIRNFLASIISASASAALLQWMPGMDISNTFRLSVNVTRLDLTPTVQGMEVGYNTAGECLANLVLSNPEEGAIFYETGNTVRITELTNTVGEYIGVGIIGTPGCTATVPSLKTVQVQYENGTEGVQVAYDDGSGVAGLEHQSCVWMECPSEDGDFVVLIFKQGGQSTLAGCANVQLLPLCDSSQDAPEGSISTKCLTSL